jgi:hypothetical protein
LIQNRSRDCRGVVAIADQQFTFLPVSVTVVCICSADHLTRCLEALRRQRDAPDFDVIVAYDPHIPGVDAVAEAFPEARMVCNEGQRTPLELASRAVRESTGELILLTEDHCVPGPCWVRTMIDAQSADRAAVGGRIEVSSSATATDWAFYFVDFFRYASPVVEGPSPTLTVCNVSYKRQRLAEVRDLWVTFFMETVINDALRQRYGDLWLHAGSEVTMNRHVTFRDAVYERYAFGRLFGYTRNGFCSPGRRVYYAIFAPTLPILLLGRMARAALRSSRLTRGFLRSLAPLSVMVLSWSWGEWLGYITGRLPKTLVVAPEIREAHRRAKY